MKIRNNEKERNMRFITVFALMFLAAIFSFSVSSDIAEAAITNITFGPGYANDSEIFTNPLNTTYQIRFRADSNVSAGINGSLNCTIHAGDNTTVVLAANASMNENEVTNISIPFSVPLRSTFSLYCQDGSETHINNTGIHWINLNTQPRAISVIAPDQTRKRANEVITWTVTANDTDSNQTASGVSNDSIDLYVCRENVFTPGTGCSGTNGQFCSQTAQRDGGLTCDYTILSSDGKGETVNAYVFIDDGNVNSSSNFTSFKTTGTAVGVGFGVEETPPAFGGTAASDQARTFTGIGPVDAILNGIRNFIFGLFGRNN